jgi:hypothetical protein
MYWKSVFHPRLLKTQYLTKVSELCMSRKLTHLLAEISVCILCWSPGQKCSVGSKSVHTCLLTSVLHTISYKHQIWNDIPWPNARNAFAVQPVDQTMSHRLASVYHTLHLSFFYPSKPIGADRKNDSSRRKRWAKCPGCVARDGDQLMQKLIDCPNQRGVLGSGGWEGDGVRCSVCFVFSHDLLLTASYIQKLAWT